MKERDKWVPMATSMSWERCARQLANPMDASGATKAGTVYVAETLNPVTMMLVHEIFDPETSRRVLVDHAFIVADGEITKSANWWGNKLDAGKRSQIMFMDHNDILNL